MKEVTSTPHGYGSRSRGVNAADVERAADQLLRSGERPTVEKIRASLGTGSPNTINPLLDAWWKRVGNRLDAGPAALHRLPEGVAHIAESLWMQALEEARRRAVTELSSDKRAVDRAKDGYEVRSHVLSLREGELDSRLRERERLFEELQVQTRTLTLLLQKEQRTRERLTQRLAELEAVVATRRAPRETSVRRPHPPANAPKKRRNRKTLVKKARSKKRVVKSKRQ